MTKTSLRDQAYKYLREKILTGSLQTGSMVSELSLSKEIGIGRTPVREAIRQLQLEGLVEQVPRYGTIVCKPNRHDLIELYQIREGLEPYAVGLAIDKISLEEVNILDKLCDKMQDIACEFEKSGDKYLEGDLLKLFVSVDMTFHTLLIRAAGNERIEKIVDEMRMFNRLFITQRHFHDLTVITDAHSFHQRILDAIKQKDVDLAKDLLTKHIRIGLQQALDNYDRNQSQPPIGISEEAEVVDDMLRELSGNELGEDG